MPRRVKDFIDISEYTSLDDLIRYLQTIRDNLPPEHQAELKIRGDEVFGRRLTITYFREQTPDEVELETKYAADQEAGIEDLRRSMELGPITADLAFDAAYLCAFAAKSDPKWTEPALSYLALSMQLGLDPQEASRDVMFRDLAKAPRFAAVLKTPAHQARQISSALIDPLAE